VLFLDILGGFRVLISENPNKIYEWGGEATENSSISNHISE